MSSKSRLREYEKIAEGKLSPRYLRTKAIHSNFAPESSIKSLWELHGSLSVVDSSSETFESRCSLLDLKSVLADRILSECQFCERRCRANRKEGIKGHCGVLESRITNDFIHMGEEPEVIPSYTIFFAGCTFECAFCQNWDISTNPENGNIVEPEKIALMIEERDPHLERPLARTFDLDRAFTFGHPHFAKNVNWVGGEPTPNIAYILRVLSLCKSRLPQIWNSNMYMTEESMKLLSGVIDLYLTDFKYGNDACAKRLSGIDNFFEVASRNHLIADKQCDVIVRHLVMPNHIECCTRTVLEWIAEKTPNVVVNVMAQYHPEHKAGQFKEIARRPTEREITDAIEIAQGLGLNLTH